MKLLKIKRKKDKGENLIDLVYKYHQIGTPYRKETFNKVLEQGKGIDSPFAYLAMAWANANLGATKRKDAIKYFEKYFSNPVEHEFLNFRLCYLELAKLYEAEYDFKNAEKYYILSYNEPCTLKELGMDGSNVSLGRLYLKISTKKALKFWENEMKSIKYLNNDDYKRCVDVEYKKTLEKHNKGYVYKPRKK